MAQRFQHYVPQVYLRAWETGVRSIKEPDKVFKGVYFFNKNDLHIGDGRNVKSILSQQHTYTIGYESSFLFQEMPEVAKDYGEKILAVLDKHDAEAFFNGKKLDCWEDLTSAELFATLNDWEFYKKGNITQPARKNSILKDIKAIHSYVIEVRLDNFLENDWERKRDDFLRQIKNKTRGLSQDNVTIDQNLIYELVKSMLLLMCRNPAFDCLGIFSKIKDVFTYVFSEDNVNEKVKISSSNIADDLVHGAWLAEIYKGLFQGDQGFYKVFFENILEKCSVSLLYCPEENGSFITSDNPAFMYISSVEKINRNGFYFPLSPQYLLLFGKKRYEKITCIDVHRITNEEVRHINSIILNKSINAIISRNRRLGYLL